MVARNPRPRAHSRRAALLTMLRDRRASGGFSGGVEPGGTRPARRAAAVVRAAPARAPPAPRTAAIAPLGILRLQAPRRFPQRAGWRTVAPRIRPARSRSVTAPLDHASGANVASREQRP